MVTSDVYINYIADANRENASGTERGVVLVWASIIDDVLLRMLDAHTDNIPDKREALFGNNAPFGSFSNRAKASLALRLISMEEFRQIKFVRTLRNRFAHQIGTTLSDPATSKQCFDFLESTRFPSVTDNPRLAFVGGCIALTHPLIDRLVAMLSEEPNGRPRPAASLAWDDGCTVPVDSSS